ncbi:MAG: hypothetical protein M3N16_01595 [Actinomycetota bacterium]|nr:hypothetical protein [Actinomycetota bacterium]
MRRYAATLALALALAGCGEEDRERRGTDPAQRPGELERQAAYACMPESEQRQYDAFAKRLRTAVRQAAARGADGDEVHDDKQVSALEDVMDSMVDRYETSVGGNCGKP